MKFTARITLLALIAFVVATASAHATVLLSVDGTTDNPITFNTSQAVAASFNLGVGFSNVSISANIICGSCAFTAYLMEANLGPTAAAADLVQAATFTGVPLGGTLFSGLNLVADDYFVIIANTGAPSIIWVGGASPTVSSLASVTHLEDWASLDSSTFDLTFPPNSVFDVILNQGARFYTVNADAVTNPNPGNSVPEPSSIGLLLLGAALIRLMRQRK